MLGHRELTMEDYAEILKRRIWLILTTVVILLAAGIALAHFVTPNTSRRH